MPLPIRNDAVDIKVIPIEARKVTTQLVQPKVTNPSAMAIEDQNELPLISLPDNFILAVEIPIVSILIKAIKRFKIILKTTMIVLTSKPLFLESR